MFKKIKEFFVGKPASERHPLDAVTAPYKVEPPVSHTYDVPPAPGVTTLAFIPPAAPTAKKCGCGRSSSGFCVGLHALSAEEWATSTDNPDYVTKVVVPEPVKKPRKPRTPKVVVAAAPVKAVKEKAPATARAPKLTVLKAEKKTKSKKA